MVKSPREPLPPNEFAEEAIPFDEVLRQLLAAKPVHRKASAPALEAEPKPDEPQPT